MRPTLYCTLFLTAVLCALPVVATQAQDNDSEHAMRRTVTVSGEGTARAEPDQATVRFGVVTEAQDPEAARQQNAEAASQAMNAVRELGIPEGQIRLETLRLQPRYEYDPQRRTREQVGYEAVRIVVVELDSLDLLPMLITRVVQRGANRLQGIQYDLQDQRRDAVRNEALQEALRNARDKARLLTETLDVSLGQVLHINEQSFNFPRPFFDTTMMARAESAEAAPQPDAYAAGEIEVNATVQVVFALE